MPFDNDPTTDPDFVERQYRAGNDQYDLNIELADSGGFARNALFGRPLFDAGNWGNALFSFTLVNAPGPRRIDPDDFEQ